MLGAVCYHMRFRGLHGDRDRRGRRRSYSINLRTGRRSSLTPKIRGPGLAERAEISIHHAGAARTGTGQNRVYSKTRPAGPFHCCHFYMRSTPLRRSAAAPTKQRKLLIVKQNNTKQCCRRLKHKQTKKVGRGRKENWEVAIRGHLRHFFFFTLMQKVGVLGKGRWGGKLQKLLRKHRACAPGTIAHVARRWLRRRARRRCRQQEVTPTPPPLLPPPGSAHSLAPGGSGGGGRGRCSDREARAAARPRSCPAALRGGGRARLGRPGAEFLNFLGKLWSRHCRSGRGNRRRRRKRRSRHRRMRWRSRGAEQLQPLPGAFACNPAASGRRRPPPMTSRPLPPLHAPRPARAPAAEAARRSSRPHWPRPRERATPTCREPMGARLASPSAVAARTPLLFSEPARPFACNRKPNN